MPKLKFTDRSLKALKPKEQRTDYFDSTLPGFSLRVTTNGIKSWCVMYRHGGRLRMSSGHRLLFPFSHGPFDPFIA